MREDDIRREFKLTLASWTMYNFSFFYFAFDAIYDRNFLKHPQSVGTFLKNEVAISNQFNNLYN